MKFGPQIFQAGNRYFLDGQTDCFSVQQQRWASRQISATILNEDDPLFLDGVHCLILVHEGR